MVRRALLVLACVGYVGHAAATCSNTVNGATVDSDETTANGDVVVGCNNGARPRLCAACADSRIHVVSPIDLSLRRRRRCVLTRPLRPRAAVITGQQVSVHGNDNVISGNTIDNAQKWLNVSGSGNVIEARACAQRRLRTTPCCD